MTRIPLYDKNTGRRIQEQCPFGERDLKTDECYSGMGKNRCPYFIKYEHFMTGEILPDGSRVRTCMSYIQCKCDKPRKGTWVQLELF